MSTPALNIQLDLQIAEELSEDKGIPKDEDMLQWIETGLDSHNLKANTKLKDIELSLRVVGEAESTKLNAQYRGKDSSTNVLSFPAEIPEFVESPLIGDLLICAPVVNREAQEQNKDLNSHWAHMLIHGLLHLLGYDHIENQEAELMESLEILALKQLGISNPYL